jgi:hypothetical protein
VREKGGQGSCTNPHIVTELGFSPSVRELELHCRRGWNNDRWQAATDDVVLDIRTKHPDADTGSGSVPISMAVPNEPDDASISPAIEGIDRIISLSVAADR